jgi:signal transduction histidine kinase
MARRAAVTDVLLALALGLEMQLELLFVDAPRRDVLIGRVAVLALAGALLVRRRVPVLAAVLGLAGIILLESRGNEVSDDLAGPFFSLLFVSYSIGAYAEGRQLAAAATVLLGGVVVAIRLDDPPGGWDDLFFGLTVITGGPLLMGRLVNSRARLNRALHEKALAVEEDRAARAAGAVAEERARIAGELHHLVSAALASMVGQAGAAEQLVRDKPDVAERAFASVETTGREALAEIRRLLGVLRRDDEELALAPQPSLAHVRDLVARARAAGLPVELEVEGERGHLPAGVDLTAYRVIQEALDGALDAPDERRATVRLRYGDADVALEVTDVGAARPGSERRLLGVRERVAIYGGELVAEPTEGAGYAVRARLPLERVA